VEHLSVYNWTVGSLTEMQKLFKESPSWTGFLLRLHRSFQNGEMGSSTIASDEKGLAVLPAPFHFIFGPGLFSEPLLRPLWPAFPHSP
jgi:hypothetical protein